MKKEMLKPAIIVLSLVSVFAVAFVLMNTLAFAGAREDVVRTSETSIGYEAEDLAREMENNVEELDKILAETELATESANEATKQAQAEEDRVILSRLGLSDEDMEAVLAEIQRIREYDGGYGVIAVNQGSYYAICLTVGPVIFLRGGVIAEVIPEDSGFFYTPAVGFQLPPGYSSIEDFVGNPSVHEIRFDFDVLEEWFGSGRDPMFAWIPYPGNMSFTMVDQTRWNMVTQSHTHAENYVLQPHHLTFEQVAALAALAIFHEYGISVDGLEGYMHFMGHGNAFYFADGVWTGFILDPTRTEHNMGDELFHFMINAVTGEITHLDMTTPSNPWHG